MYDLIRFFDTKEHAEAFLAGHLYMNTLDSWWNAGKEDPAESYEGAVAPQNLLFGGEKSAEVPFGGDLSRTHARLDAVRYCNVFSMMKHAYDYQEGLVEQIPEEALSFGPYEVIVSNLEKFVTMIANALIKEADKGLLGIMGPVNYRDKILVNSDLDLFDRKSSFAWQKEWRLVCIRRRSGFSEILEKHPNLQYEIPEDLEIGSIAAFSELVSTKDLVRNITSIYRGYARVKQVKENDRARFLGSQGVPIPYDTYCDAYVGYTPRSAFLGKVLETDCARVRVLDKID